MDRLEPQQNAETRRGMRLGVTAAALFSMVAFLAGFGPGWIRYRGEAAMAMKMEPDPVRMQELPGARPPLPPSAAILAMVAPEAPQAEPEPADAVVPILPSPASSELESELASLWQSLKDTPPSKLPVPEPVQALLEGERPVTSAGILEALGTLPYTDRMESWCALILHADAKALQRRGFGDRVGRPAEPERPDLTRSVPLAFESRSGRRSRFLAPICEFRRSRRGDGTGRPVHSSRRWRSRSARPVAPRLFTSPGGSPEISDPRTLPKQPAPVSGMGLQLGRNPPATRRTPAVHDACALQDDRKRGSKRRGLRPLRSRYNAREKRLAVGSRRRDQKPMSR